MSRSVGVLNAPCSDGDLLDAKRPGSGAPRVAHADVVEAVVREIEALVAGCAVRLADEQIEAAPRRRAERILSPATHWSNGAPSDSTVRSKLAIALAIVVRVIGSPGYASANIGP